MTKLNKRILSALLAVVLLLTNFPVVSAASDGFAIHYEGMAVAEVEFYEHERITVSAEGNPGSGYQWQIKIPGTEQWVNIQGQTGQTINLSKAVVGSLMVDGSAHVRCAAISDGQEIDHTAALCTTVKKEEPAPVAPVVNAPVVTPVEPVPEATEAPTEAPAEPIPETTEPPVEVTEAPIEPIPEVTEVTIEATAAPTEPAVENEPAPEVVKPSEVPVETTEIPEEIAEIPAETAASTEPEAEVVVAAPAEAPTEEPAAVPEIPAETAAPVEMEAEVVVTAPAENSAKPAEVPTEEPAAVPEIPAETAAPTEPEAEVVATAPAEEPATAPVEEEPAETFVDKVVKFFAPRAAADESSDIEIVTVTVHYRAVDRENKFETTHMDAGLKENAAAAEPVTDPYVAHIVSGSDLEVTVPCHVMPGYTLTVPAFHEDEPIRVSNNNLVLNLSSVTEDQTFYIYYVESKVSYTARYFMQNVYNDLYTERTDILTTEIQNKMVGYPNAEPDPEIIYPDIYGFTALFFQPDTIAADGSTVFEVYYDRNYYLMNFNMVGGFGTAPVYARYETAFTVAQPTKSGHIFNGWKEDESKRAVNADGSTETDSAFVAALETHINGIPTQNGRVTKIPFSNLTYEAKWIQGGTTYKVAYWILHDNGDKTYLGGTTSSAQSGTTVSGDGDLDGKIVCGKEGHVHGDSCMNCGHTHTSDCYSYLNSQNEPNSTEIAAMKALGTGEPEAGYIYRIDYNNSSYYRVNCGTKWNGWSLSLGQIDSMVSGKPLGHIVYTDENGTNYEVYKYHAKFDSSYCDHTHDDSCAKSCYPDVHVHDDSCKLDTSRMEYIEEKTLEIDGENVTFKTDKNLTVEGDGSTVVNVYYQYKEYTLKFYYARTTGGTDTNGDGIPDSDFTSVQIPGGTTRPFGYRGGYDMGASVDTDDDATLLKNVGSWGTITDTALPSLKSNTTTYSKRAIKITITDTDYYYHYLEFKARYRDNISAKWPCDVFNSVERSDGEKNGYNDEWTSQTALVSAWNPESRVKYVYDNQNSTIKGKYEVLDDSLLFRIPTYEDASEVSFLCFWENGKVDVNWNIPELYRYNIFLEALPNQDLTNKVVVTKVENGETKTFYRFNQYDTCDDSDIDAQTQPSMVGYTRQYYTADSETYEGAEVNESNKLSGFQYKATGIDDAVFEYRTLTEGTDYPGTVYREGYELNFYYRANGPYTLNFWNLNDYMVDGDGEQFYYGASLSKFKASDNNTFMTEGYTWNGTTYGPYYPDSLEPKAYTFAGWYTSSECYDETKVNWETMTMPDADLTVYAKWVPVEYTTYFYMDYERYMDGPPFHTATNTPHGESILSEKLNALQNLAFKDKTDKVNPKYRFVNWFYIDTDGTKKAFNPSEMAVRKELHLFAEWTSSEVREYTVSYQYGVQDPITGEYGPVSPAFTMAENSKGYALEATTKTFTALPREKLDNYPSQNDGYPNLDLDTSDQLWLPHTNSHSIVMREDNEENVFTFYYVTKENVTYTVKYLDAATQEPVMPEESITISEAVVTVPFKYKAGYIPDAFHKRLVLSANDEENVVIFYYTKDENASGGDTGGGVSSQRYLVMHHYPAIEGDPNSEDVVQEYDYIDRVGNTVTATQEFQKGFVFDEAKTKEEYKKWFDITDAEQYVKQVDGKWTVSGEVTSGEDDGDNKPLVLNLYYSREKFSYKVRYIDRETKVPIQDDKMVYDIPFGKTVSETSIEIKGYDLYGADESGKKTLDLTISWDKDKNVITFEYIKKKVTIKYVPICTEPGLTGGFGGVSNPIDYDKTTPFGSIAFAASGFHFKGWYSDEEGNKQVEEGVRFQPQVDPSTGIYDYTYYALFEPITLTISQENMAENDSAVYEVLQGTTVVARVMLTGTGSVTLMAIPAGNYTVKEVSGNWTWTYNDPAPDSGTVEVVAGKKNAVTFNYADRHVGSCWLHNETRR